MNQLRLLLLILCLSFFHAEAQNAFDSDQSTLLKPLRPSIAVVIGIISVMLSATLIILAYAKFCRGNRTSDRLFTDTDHQSSILGGSRSRFSGIDRELIDSLPFFRFSSLKGSKQGLECAVCLSKFEDIEILRLLPKCKHAFHVNCIDQWLENHSSCPLCRYKFDPSELKSFSYSSSLRYLHNPSNLTDDPNIEIFIQREQDYHQQASPSRFKLGKGEKEELLVQQSNNKKFWHKFKHKIIVSDAIIKSRWSDVNSSDFLSLSSEMLHIMSSNRFSSSARFQNTLSINEQIENIKEDMERKRSYESKIIRADNSDSASTSYKDEYENSSKMINNVEKRSMSEITVCSRFNDLSLKEDRTRRLWLPIARRTVQWFAGEQESNV
ncbi:E3 ubiquitin-protein ligase ATL42-like [Mercurialis annua]|uniref:E3 ubiquitin-protein ligase ATL42-like n=1 Tax=Mercurialis annua TaxID=3986 RepID=UPI00215E326D|nr:E3 ubiquitin-protein ligase ATL42-like [Mercurialis annua]